MVDVPFVRDVNPADFDRAYVRAQIEKLVPLCEEVSGVRFDPDRPGRPTPIPATV